MMKRILLKLLLPLAIASKHVKPGAPELIPLYPDAVMKASLDKIPPFPEDERGGPQAN